MSTETAKKIPMTIMGIGVLGYTAGSSRLWKNDLRAA